MQKMFEERGIKVHRMTDSNVLVMAKLGQALKKIMDYRGWIPSPIMVP